MLISSCAGNRDLPSVASYSCDLRLFILGIPQGLTGTFSARCSSAIVWLSEVYTFKSPSIIVVIKLGKLSMLDLLSAFMRWNLFGQKSHFCNVNRLAGPWASPDMSAYCTRSRALVVKPHQADLALRCNRHLK